MSDRGSNTTNESWNVRGTVFYKGLPCRPEDQRVPPCSGPYPNYEVIVHPKGDNHTISGRASTNSKGEFKIWLYDGEYVIYTQAGQTASIRKANEFKIQNGKAWKNLIIDTGVR